MTPFFFSEISENTGILTEEEARHCVKVLRLRRGDQVLGIDGRGKMYVGIIEELGKQRVEVRFHETHENWGEHPYRIAVWVSPLHKADRFEWLVEKCVELGATSFHPYVSKRTVKTGLRVGRLERIATSALKQCLRSRLPEIHEPVEFAEIPELATGDLKLFGWMEATEPLTELQKKIEGAKSLDLLIGPEGGFSEEEAAAAKAAGFLPISLGNNRLRTETAAIHTLSMVKTFKNY